MLQMKLCEPGRADGKKSGPNRCILINFVPCLNPVFWEDIKINFNLTLILKSPF
jgi:hypothetical protein